MKKKVIAYVVIVAVVFLFMYFRQSIYYMIQESDGFYIDKMQELVELQEFPQATLEYIKEIVKIGEENDI